MIRETKGIILKTSDLTEGIVTILALLYLLRTNERSQTRYEITLTHPIYPRNKVNLNREVLLQKILMLKEAILLTDTLLAS